MPEPTQYWLFQAKPADIDLESALRQEALQSFPVLSHKKRIRTGDRVLLWQTGKHAGCYALAEVTSEPATTQPGAEEEPFWHNYKGETDRVELSITANMWNRPIGWEALKILPAFEQFNGGRPGLNYRATADQFATVEDLIRAQDAQEQTEPDYGTGEWLNPPLNQILYGPPGTGKTYRTVIHALSIIENRPADEYEMEDRRELRRRFDSYMANGQIGFVTFHQSFSYEDFVEGIRPVTRQGKLHYELVDGIFKILANEARGCLLNALLKAGPAEPEERDFHQLYGAFLAFLESDHFKYFEHHRKRRFFLHRILRFGNLSLRAEKTFSTIQVRKSTLQRLYHYFPTAHNLDPQQQIVPLVGTPGLAAAYYAVFAELKSFEASFQSVEPAEKPAAAPEGDHMEMPLLTDEILLHCRRYVLIIDEINRGNLPAILGELITLLEADKREGRAESLPVVLPYSRRYFSVPANLYLIATMNTADRSAEPLDAALRRRFAMVEVPPQPELLLTRAETPRVEGIDLSRMLIAINQRLSLLLDDDHRLGHTYFLSVNSLDELRDLFEQQILPLLREFFYDDVRKIGLVLGSPFLQPRAQSSVLADFDYPLPPDLQQGVAYGLRPMREISEADFISIYEG